MDKVVITTVPPVKSYATSRLKVSLGSEYVYLFIKDACRLASEIMNSVDEAHELEIRHRKSYGE